MYHSNMYRLQLLVFTLIYCVGYGVSASDVAPICCFPKQFESLMFAVNTGVDAANIGVSNDVQGNLGVVFGMANGTIRTAYDAVNRRTYMFTDYIWTKSDEPGSLNVTVAIIQDYKQNVRYQVIQGVLCEQGPIEKPLFIECIPGNATFLSEGIFGNSSVMTYLTTATLDQTEYQIVITVIVTDGANAECVPLRISLTNNPPDIDAMVIVADVVDVTSGIKDTTIFNKPPVCNNDLG